MKKLRLRNFQDSQVSSFDVSTLYTSFSNDLIQSKVLYLVHWCFKRESKTVPLYFKQSGLFSNKKYDSHKCWTSAELFEAFTFLIETYMCNCNLKAWFMNK